MCSSLRFTTAADNPNYNRQISRSWIASSGRASRYDSRSINPRFIDLRMRAASVKNAAAMGRIDICRHAQSAQGSVKLVDSISIQIKSGQRSLSKHATGSGGQNTAKTKEDNGGASPGFHGAEMGTLLELEPVVGPDNAMVDMHVPAHLPSRVTRNGFALRGSHRNQLSFTIPTSFTAWKEYPEVLHSAPVPNQPGKYFVVVARVNLSDLEEWKLPPPKPGIKPGVIAVAPKEGSEQLPVGMLMKCYKVPPGFIQGALPDGTMGPSLDVKKFFKNMGVEFPPGSEATYDPATSTIIIIDTQENLDLVDQIVERRFFCATCSRFRRIVGIRMRFLGCKGRTHAG